MNENSPWNFNLDTFIFHIYLFDIFFEEIFASLLRLPTHLLVLYIPIRNVSFWNKVLTNSFIWLPPDRVCGLAVYLSMSIFFRAQNNTTTSLWSYQRGNVYRNIIRGIQDLPLNNAHFSYKLHGWVRCTRSWWIFVMYIWFKRTISAYLENWQVQIRKFHDFSAQYIDLESSRIGRLGNFNRFWNALFIWKRNA